MSTRPDAGLACLPRATLRLQLHAGYTLDHARSDLAYFARLGISHLYLSPVSQARQGSPHGYDVVDHGQVDAARGGEAALRRLAWEARQAGMGLLLDIVPNHMATDAANAWWWDVLKHGRQSAWAHWFDIDWETHALPGKVLLPFLGQPYDQALAQGEIRLACDPELGLHLRAEGRPYPVSPAALEGTPGAAAQQGQVASEAVRAWMAAHAPDHAGGRLALHALLSRQHYQLAQWRCAAVSINWRRFFEVSDLIGVCVEREEVFDAVHALPLRLYAEGLIDGLRIDHVDGLAQPLAYCRRLRAAMRAAHAWRPAELRLEPPWIVVEKILAPDETLDARWAVSGTTGYDFAADVGAVLHQGKGAAPLTRAWAGLADDARRPEAWLIQARQELLDRHFVAERKALLDTLRLVATESSAQRWSCAAWEAALDALLSHYPTYRSYVEHSARVTMDQHWFDKALQAAWGALGRSDSQCQLLQALDRHLGASLPVSEAGQRLLRRFQQLTPPLAAKSLEDTVFYRYGRLLSRNEVGSDPSVFALSVPSFHARNRYRASHHPMGLLATATHDHKRGEDARARLAVLSEIPEAWQQACSAWLKAAPKGADQGFAYMLLQTLVGAWPPELAPDDPEGVGQYLQRVSAWAVKALREGKQLSSWFEPDLEQETVWQQWLDDMMPGAPCHAVLEGVAAWVSRLEPACIANGLIQTALRLSCPGIPDLYQGTEWRDFSLVDPDNRRTVDFHARALALDQAQGLSGAWGPPLAAGGWPAEAWGDGRLKQGLIALLLALRQSCAAAFAGDYQELDILGEPDVDVLAYSRGGEIVVVAGIKCAARLEVDERGMPVLPQASWADATLSLPDGHATWQDVLRGYTLNAPHGKAELAGLLAGFPLAVLRRVQG